LLFQDLKPDNIIVLEDSRGDDELQVK